jgi:hypothetical protein
METRKICPEEAEGRQERAQEPVSTKIFERHVMIIHASLRGLVRVNTGAIDVKTIPLEVLCPDSRGSLTEVTKRWKLSNTKRPRFGLIWNGRAK